MGVTRLETRDAVFFFQHEHHGRPFVPKLNPRIVDAVILEPGADINPDDIRQFQEAPENVKGAMEWSGENGLGFWFLDLHYVEGKILLERVGLARAGVALTALGYLAYRDHLLLPYGMSLSAAAATMWGARRIADKEANDQHSYLVLKEGDIGFIDPERRGYFNMLKKRFPDVDLGAAAIAAKLQGYLVPLLNEELGRKPRIYIVYDSRYTGVIDYLVYPEERKATLRKRGCLLKKNAHPELIDSVTRWQSEGGAWKPEIVHPKIPELEQLRILPLVDVERNLDRRPRDRNR